ncbi:TRAP transporter permease [Endozoicomonas ascidiicola]|uniref:TRAP transporter permease n=1 Tax=Endozoicomonas ascidiicola TaxID=1698521 RepID=UPI000A6DF9DC|nr:TRAP transporter permease [Endozoicomonas ascidiicola]
MDTLNSDKLNSSPYSEPANSAEQIVNQSEQGGRQPQGAAKFILLGIALIWSLFQLWNASPLPYIFNIGIFNDGQSRAIHLAFAIFLAFIAYPARKTSFSNKVPVTDWMFALAGSFCASYLYIFHRELATRAGAPITLDLITAATGMLLLLEATRRALGPPLMIVAAVFITYAFAGPYMPDVIAHKGASLNKALSHFWITTEGVFGVALGVSTSFVFLFVLFGSLLEKAGAGNYFIQVAFSLLGHLKGGPAKAAVVSSGLSGIVSGSSIANVVTTGTFTIPLMKKVGFPAHKAGAIEVAASTNGQLTPPIMGAAAFLMVEYVGISYIDVIRHALLPALISYIALFYIVHLEALKAGMQGLPKSVTRTKTQALMSFTGTFAGMCVLGAAVYYGVGWTQQYMGDHALWIISVALLGAYLVLLKIAAAQPDLITNIEDEIRSTPIPGPTIKRGLYYLLPLVVLLWCLTVERYSPGLSAFWATLVMIFITLTHKTLIDWFRKENTITHVKEGFFDLIDGMTTGARNMIGIGVATATAGIVVGAVTLTGIGLVMTEFVEWVSGGSIILMLLFTAIICLVLGMGLPTTANYIVVSTLMAPVIVTLGAQHGLIVPLIAVHLFVFYFGILADDTPPVGLAAFAASAIAQSDPIKTGIQGFIYDIRTAILPFMFIFNTELLLIGVDSIPQLIIIVFGAIAAMLVFATGTQGHWLVKNRWYETLGLLLIAFTLFRPDFWWDKVYPPYNTYEGAAIVEQVEALPDQAGARLWVTGETLEGRQVTQMAILPAGDKGLADDRFRNMGLEVLLNDDDLIIDMVDFNSEAQKVGIDFDWQILKLEVAAERPPKQLVWIPAFLLLLLIYFGQRRRQ